MAVASSRIERAASASFDRRNRGSYVAIYRVRTDSKMGVKQIIEASTTAAPHPLPLKGDAYDLSAVYGSGEADAHSYAMNFEVDFEDANRQIALITVSYTPLEPGETPRSRTETNPLNRGAVYHWESETFQRIVDRNVDGVPIVNGASKTFDRPATIEESRPLLVAKFNVANQDAAIATTRKYDQAVNLVAWTLFTEDIEPRAALCKYARSGETQFENGIEYVPLELVFAFAEEGSNWDLSQVNEGYGHHEESDGQTYGYGFAASNYTTNTQNITLTDSVVVSGTENAPSTVPNPDYDAGVTPAKQLGKAGDQLSLAFVSGAWAAAEPTAKTENGRKVYKKAKALNSDGTESSDDVSEPILLYSSGVRLPEGMVGNFVTNRVRREVNFNALNATLSPS